MLFRRHPSATHLNQNRRSQVPYFLALMGIIAVAFSSVGVHRGLVARYWPTVPGRVLECSVSDNSRPTAHSPAEECSMLYRYTVAGKPYESRSICTDSSPDRAINFARHHAAESIVIVSYNPVDPGEAYLDTTLAWNTIFVLTIGGSFILAAILVAILTRPRTRFS